MADLQTRLSQLEQAVANPRAQLDHYLSEGKKVVGCFPVYTPENSAGNRFVVIYRRNTS